MGMVDVLEYFRNDVNLLDCVGMGIVDMLEYFRNDANASACGVMVRVVRLAGWMDGRCGQGILRAMVC